jgi:hypothetical protein
MLKASLAFLLTGLSLSGPALASAELVKEVEGAVAGASSAVTAAIPPPNEEAAPPPPALPSLAEPPAAAESPHPPLDSSPRDQVASAVNPAREIAGAGRDLAGQAPGIASVGGRGSGVASSSARPDGPSGAAPASSGSALGSGEFHRASPLRRFWIHVWPARALGPLRLLRALAPLGGVGSPLTSAASRLLTSLATPGTADSGTRPAGRGVSTPAAAPRGVGFPGGGAVPLLVLLLSFAAVAALLSYAVRAELGPMHRWLP